MIGSSADAACRGTRWGVISTLVVAFNVLIRSASSDTLGPSRPPFSLPLLDSPALSRSRRPVNSEQIGLVGECLSQTALIVAELRLSDAKVSRDAVAFRPVAGGQAFQGVEHGSRPVVISREHRLPYSRAFQIDLGWKLGVQHDAKTQAPVSAKRHTGRLAGVLRQGFKPIREDGGKVVVRINPASYGDGITGMVFAGGCAIVE